MKADKNLSIKVKSKTERRIMDDPEVEMMTEWNLKRIIAAVIVVLILIIIPAYYFSQDDTDSAKNAKMASIEGESTLKKTGDIKKIISKQAIIQASTKEIVDQETIPRKPDKNVAAKKTLAKDPAILVSPHKPVEQKDIETKPRITATKKVLQQNHSHQIVEIESLNPHITHVQLAQGVDQHIPYGQVNLPFLVDNNKARELYFFTEVINMQGSTVFHEWLREGKSIYKRKFNIYGIRWRIHTSKLISNTSIGQWQVRIITQQGKILHKMNFSVEKR